MPIVKSIFEVREIGELFCRNDNCVPGALVLWEAYEIKISYCCSVT